ncbi:MAG: hypothetical protein ACR2JP_07485 [Acidimicrobiia bacterium]
MEVVGEFVDADLRRDRGRGTGPVRRSPRPPDRRCFTLINSTPFDYGTAEQRTARRSLIATLERALRLHEHRPGTLVELADYLYQRTGGMIGSLSQIVRPASPGHRRRDRTHHAHRGPT